MILRKVGFEPATTHLPALRHNHNTTTVLTEMHSHPKDRQDDRGKERDFLVASPANAPLPSLSHACRHCSRAVLRTLVGLVLKGEGEFEDGSVALNHRPFRLAIAATTRYRFSVHRT